MASRRKVSMQDIADQLNISKNAVSLALMNKKGVSEQMRAKVRETAAALGYGSYTSASSGPSRVKNVLVLVPSHAISYQDNDHFHFYHDQIWGLEEAARSKGLNAIIARIDEKMEQGNLLPSLVEDVPSIGIILFGIISESYARMVLSLGKPVVMFDSYYRTLPCTAVSAANTEGAAEAVRYLVERGHRRIGFIGSANLTSSQTDRYFGYWKALTDAGIDPDSALNLTRLTEHNGTLEELDRFIGGLSDMPTAFFCGSDQIALKAMRIFRQRGIQVPEDVSVIGFDNVKAAAMSEPPLTTMNVNKLGMCEAAVDLILSEPDAAGSILRSYVEASLVVRETVADLRGRV